MELFDTEKFSEYKNINKGISKNFTRAGFYKISKDIDDCCTFSNFYECAACHRIEWKNYRTCKNRFCVICQTVKSRAWLGRLYSVLEEYIKQGKYIVFVTLTVDDMKELKPMINLLEHSWRNMYHQDRDYANQFKNFYEGGIRSLEVKRGDNSHDWHAHYHLILIKDYCYDVDFLREAWTQSCIKYGASTKTKSIDIKTIYAKNEDGKKVFDNEALLNAIVEALKYITKFEYSEEDEESIKELVDALSNRRQINSFGSLRNLQAQVDEDISTDHDDELVEHICKECGYTKAKVVDLLTTDLQFNYHWRPGDEVLDPSTGEIVKIEHNTFK